MAVDKLVDSAQLDSDLTSVANAIRAKGGTSAHLAFPAEFVSAIGDIPTGGGSIGGLANMVDASDSTYVFADMLSRMKNGQTVGGTVEWASAFPNTESLLLSTGLTTIHGIIIVATEQGLADPGWTQCNRFILMYHSMTSDKLFIVGLNGSVFAYKYGLGNGVKNDGAPVQGTIRVDGGDIYYTARYNKNNNYQFVRSGEPYEWLAW